jgi:hypothetical protein
LPASAGIRLSEGSDDVPLYLTEYRDLARDTNNRDIAVAMEPSVAEQALTVSGSSSQSAAFNAQTSYVMVHAQEAACLAWGTNPTATTSKQRIGANETRFVGVPMGKSFKVAAITSP